jgi:hypothetical protein
LTKPPGKKELREFAWIVGGILVLVLGYIIPWFKNIPLRWHFIWGGAGLMAVGSIYPRCLGPVYRLWMKIGHLLGKVNTFILLHIVFYCIFTPMAFILRVTGWKSPVREMPDGLAATYRLPSAAQPKERMEEIF